MLRSRKSVLWLLVVGLLAVVLVLTACGGGEEKAPPAEKPAVEKPAAEEPAAEEPVAEEPVAEEPVAEEPVAEEPAAEEPAAEEPVAEEPAIDASNLYATKCTTCHGANRQGLSGLGPALTPQSLAARSDTEIKNTITNGKPSTIMVAWKDILSPAEIEALLQLVKYTSPEEPSVSGPPAISHSLEGREGQCLVCHETGLGGAPKFPADHAGRTSDICLACHQPAG